MRRIAFLISLRALGYLVAFHLVTQTVVRAQEQPANSSFAKFQADGLEFFESRIRPLLVANCYECHNSAETAEGNLAVDWQGAMRTGGKRGSLLQTNKGKNLLLAVVRHEIPGLEMPEGGKKLGDQEIADLEEWLTMGAPDPRSEPLSSEVLQTETSWEAQLEHRKQWWSFRPITQADAPAVDDEMWPRDAIDHFVLAKLEQAGLRPAKQADARTLVRRLYLTLVGLPPSHQQITEFANDQRPDAYERLVDQLLDSQHFGERWARHWMDWVRYADSHGSEGDPEIVEAYRYRDYLIRALNADVPYDQLVREHIAGDLLAAPRTNQQLGINESMIGTAHWRFVFHGFAPTDALDEKVRFTDDAINVFSKAFMGLTVSCARCHNHKFDAISQADYYALFGIVASARPGRSAIDLPETMLESASELEKLKLRIRDSLVANWQTIDAEETARRLTAAASPEAKPGSLGYLWNELSAASSENFGGKIIAFRKQSGNALSPSTTEAIAAWDFAEEQASWHAYGAGLARSPLQAAQPRFAPNLTPPGSFYIPDSGPAIIERINPGGVFSNLRSRKLPARLASPDVHLAGAYKLYLQVYGDGDATSRYVVQDYPRNGTVFPVQKLSIAPSVGWRWQEYDLTYWNGDDIHIEIAHAGDGPLLAKPNTRSRFAVRRAMILPADSKPPTIDAWESLRPLLTSKAMIAAESMQEVADAIHSSIMDAVGAWRSNSLNDAQAALLTTCLAEGLLPNQANELESTAQLVETYRSIEQAIPFPRRIPSLAEHRGSDQPLYDRGDHHKPLNTVPRRFLEAIDATPYKTTLSGRRQLAEDVLRHDNPFTARVIVNRLWHHLFGRGLVATPDNFGRLGEEPSHPELLDYLAVEFRDTHHWRIKDLLRRIVTSATWRQATLPADPLETHTIDPNNKFWSHMPVRRLGAESIRDSLLVASAKIDRQLFGPSVAGSVPRRSIYVRAKRNSLDPFLTTFDSPVPFSTKGRRDATNVPAQSLLLMNSAFVAKLAQHLADSVTKRHLSDTEQTIEIWKAILAREPTADELTAAEQFVAAQASSYQQLRLQHSQLNQQLADLRGQLSSLHTQAEELWQHAHPDAFSPSLPNDFPQALWKFGQNENDDYALKGTAKRTPNGIALDGSGWLESAPQQQELHEKTLIAEVQLGNLSQQGGGVLTVQTIGGGIFDAIVFGEQQERHWLAGSNNFARTEPFAGGVAETLGGDNTWVHVALTYQGDEAENGVITLFRNGQQYGKPYSKPLHAYESGQWQVLVGLRHGTSATGNRPLKGTVRRAAVYNLALSPKQVAEEYRHASGPTREEMLAALPADKVELVGELRAREDELAKRIAAFPIVPGAEQHGNSQHGNSQHWADLAHALFNLKEFIYVK